MVFHMA